jgi:outer membrane protein OmpA-like peptidoglycan-associated protein
MKIHISRNLVLAFFLASVITFPATAQQSNSGSQTTSSSSRANLEPLSPPAHTNFWDGDDPNLVNLVTHPFANKKYVQRMTRPIQDRLNELDELTAANSAAIKDVDARSQHGIQLASEKSSLADQHASDAAARAQQAQIAASSASTNVTTAEQMVGNLDVYKASAQTEIRFRPGQTALSKQAKDALDEMTAPLQGQHSYVIEVRGFSFGSGQRAIAASQKIADSVVRYLVLSHNIPVYRIYTLGMGSATAVDDGEAKRGARVEVSLMKNDVASSTQR